MLQAIVRQHEVHVLFEVLFENQLED